MKKFGAELVHKVEHYSREYKMLTKANWHDENDSRD
jgi:hypothetical protein